MFVDMQEVYEKLTTDRLVDCLGMVRGETVRGGKRGTVLATWRGDSNPSSVKILSKGLYDFADSTHSGKDGHFINWIEMVKLSRGLGESKEDIEEAKRVLAEFAGVRVYEKGEVKRLAPTREFNPFSNDDLLFIGIYNEPVFGPVSCSGTRMDTKGRDIRDKDGTYIQLEKLDNNPLQTLLDSDRVSFYEMIRDKAKEKRSHIIETAHYCIVREGRVIAKCLDFPENEWKAVWRSFVERCDRIICKCERQLDKGKN